MVIGQTEAVNATDRTRDYDKLARRSGLYTQRCPVHTAAFQRNWANLLAGGYDVTQGRTQREIRRKRFFTRMARFGWLRRRRRIARVDGAGTLLNRDCHTAGSGIGCRCMDFTQP